MVPIDQDLNHHQPDDVDLNDRSEGFNPLAFAHHSSRGFQGKEDTTSHSHTERN